MHKSLVIKIKGKNYTKKFYAILIALVILTGISALSPIIPLLTNSIPIGSKGLVSIPSITAKSGYWIDIQEAVDWVVAHGGIGNVYIPAGTWNFVNINDTWNGGAKVVVPAGVNIFGAPTERTSDLPYDGIGMNPNDQVVDWKTVLQIPVDFPHENGKTSYFFFKIEGDGNPNKSSRVSDIKFVGPREFNHSSSYWYGAIWIKNVVNWRVDHCFFKNIPADCIAVWSDRNQPIKGVIDHSKFINDYGYVDWWIYNCTVGYGVSIAPFGSTLWEDNITKVLGKYNWNTVFIENSYFSRWRHSVASNDGAHYVFRHNTIEKDSVVGSLDGHGTFNYIGTRAMEIYNNLIIDPVINWVPNYNSTTSSNGDEGYTINWRGGGGVFFNNYIRNYKYGIYMVDEGTVEKCWPHNIWIWNNTWVNVEYPILTYSYYRNITEGVDYFLRAPSLELDGFQYVPYSYPHPLTLKGTP